MLGEEAEILVDLEVALAERVDPAEVDKAAELDQTDQVMELTD
jgi:hypothetical protein